MLCVGLVEQEAVGVAFDDGSVDRFLLPRPILP